MAEGPVGPGLTNPSENCISPLTHSSKKPRAEGTAGADQSLQGFRAQLQLLASGGEHAVRTRDGARRAHASAGGHFEVARINALLVDARSPPPDS